MHTIEILDNFADIIERWRAELDDFRPVYTGHTFGAGRDFPLEVDYDESGADRIIEEAQEAIYDAAHVPDATASVTEVGRLIIEDFPYLPSDPTEIEAWVITTYANALEIG